MLRLTRISDGREYFYNSEAEFKERRAPNNSNNQNDFHLNDDIMSEINDLVDFIQQNNVIDRLNKLIVRYSA